METPHTLTNPRELRAFAQSARARACTTGLPEDILRAAEYDVPLRAGGKRARAMGVFGPLAAAAAGYSVAIETGRGNRRILGERYRLGASLPASGYAFLGIVIPNDIFTPNIVSTGASMGMPPESIDLHSASSADVRRILGGADRGLYPRVVGVVEDRETVVRLGLLVGAVHPLGTLLGANEIHDSNGHDFAWSRATSLAAAALQILHAQLAPVAEQ